jgi:Protein of unknown function (DUF2971)
MSSARFLHPPDRVFRRVYHLTSAEHAISSISLRRLKVARFSEVNDPFELLALNSRKKEIRQWAKSFKEEYNRTMGLLCFSANWKSPLLWSHYANKHEGVCLGFDVSRKEVSPVIYTNKRLEAELNKSGDQAVIPEDLQDLLVLTKSDHYMYEQEFRVLLKLEGTKGPGLRTTREQGLYFSPFGKDLHLAEIVLGPRSSLSLSAVRKLRDATNPDALVFRARLAHGSFDIVPNGTWPPA